MLPINALQKLFLLLPLHFQSPAQPNNGAQNSQPEWSYENVDDWGLDYPTCDGYRQSPIYINSNAAFYAPITPLYFENYNLPLTLPLTITNNGHTVNIDLTQTINGYRPSISGAKLLNRYEAIGLHFHWGSRNNPGSEHVINGIQYDVEMHIVHKNVLYPTVTEATQYSDGLAVLGIMIEKVNHRPNNYPALYKILRKLPQIIRYNSKARLTNGFALSNLLGDLYTKEFYTYKGSLTTPPCSQAVTWFVFPDVIPIRASAINQFFNLENSHNGSLIDNFRPLQDLNGRKVFYTDSTFQLPLYPY